jgi:hypothetical protein
MMTLRMIILKHEMLSVIRPNVIMSSVVPAPALSTDIRLACKDLWWTNTSAFPGVCVVQKKRFFSIDT